MMYHIHYDVVTGKVLGFFCSGISTLIPSPTIQVDETVKNEVSKYPHRFKIIDKRLTPISPESLPLSRVRKEVGEFEFENAVYVADRLFLSNLSVNLSIANHKKDHTCMFWCMIDGAFKKREHDGLQLLLLAQAYEKERTELMGD